MASTKGALDASKYNTDKGAHPRSGNAPPRASRFRAMRISTSHLFIVKA